MVKKSEIMVFKILLLVICSVAISYCVIYLIRQHIKENKEYKRTKDWEHRVELYNKITGSMPSGFTIPTIKKEYKYYYKLDNGEINYEKRIGL